MAVTTIDADVVRDRGLLIETLGRFLTPLSDGRRFDWLYKGNPAGLARTWLAIDAQTECVIGTAAAFPRRCYWGQTEISAWVFGDFCLDAQYRSLGPALRLQRACFGALGANDAMFCYDFPSSSMAAVYKRLGVPVAGKILRLAKVLRVDRKIRGIVNIPVVTRAVSMLGNSVLGAMPVTRASDSSVEVSTYQGHFGEEFSILAERLRGRLGICIQRSAEYLNWRYEDNPLERYETIAARRHGELEGYAIWTEAGEDACVIDLFGENDPAIVKGLLSEIVATLRRRAVMTLSVWLNDNHPWLSWYTEMGFRVRDSAPIVCVPSPAFANVVDLRAGKWFLMQGDRDS